MRVESRQRSLSIVSWDDITITTETETVISWRRGAAGVHLIDGAKRPTTILVQAGNRQFCFELPVVPKGGG